MKPGLLQPTLVRVSGDAAMTIRELARAVKVVHRVYGPWPSLQAEEVPAGACAGNFIRPGESHYVCISAAPDGLVSPRRSWLPRHDDRLCCCDLPTSV